jgi:probable phosphoglycerate mutase
MTRIFIARHAETDWNRLRRIQGGRSDTPLNETGLKQVKCLAERLAREKLQLIVSSPLSRARVTAEAVAAANPTPIEIEPDLREIDAGDLEGLYATDIGGGLGKLLTTVYGDGLTCLPGGESLAHVRERAWAVITKLSERFPVGDVLIVTHYFVILSLICRLLGLPEADIRKFRLNTCSLSLIEMDAAGARLVCFNDAFFQVDSYPW